MSANPAFVFVEAEPDDVVALFDRDGLDGLSRRGAVFSGSTGVIEVDDGAEGFEVPGFTRAVVATYGPELTKPANSALGRVIYDLVVGQTDWPVALADGDSVVVITSRPTRDHAGLGVEPEHQADVTVGRTRGRRPSALR